jgi:hypothetical protein
MTIDNMTHILQQCSLFTNHPVYSWVCLCENICIATFVESRYEISSLTVGVSQMLGLLEEIFDLSCEDVIRDSKKLR